MKLHVKLLLCFGLLSSALPIVAYHSLLNPRIRRSATFVNQSHQEVLSEYRLLVQLQVIDRCLQEIKIADLRQRANQGDDEAIRSQRVRARGELYSTLAAFKQQFSAFTRVQGEQWRSLSSLEHFDAPEDSENQERAMIASITDVLPALEKNIGNYLDLGEKSPAAASQLLEQVLDVQLRRQLIPGVTSATDATGRRMEEEAQKIELTLDRAYKQTAATVTSSLFLSLVLTVVISRSVGKPIRKLSEAALVLGEGDLSARVDIDSKDELGDLAKVFNRMGADLQRHAVERLQAQEILERTNQKLTASLGELHVRSSESALIGEMANMLQSCVSLQEASQVIARALERGLPGTSGALFLFSESRNLVEEISAWGDTPPKESVFPPGDCWALRRGTPYGLLDAQIGMPCVHLGEETLPYLCVPLSAQGDTLGVLHLRCLPENAVLLKRNSDGTPSSTHLAAVTFAEQAALALANLKLRDTLKYQSIRDPLTGLFNRRYMEEALEAELGRSTRRSRSFSIFMLDLDHFKKFNDTFGHEAGDVMLREFAYNTQKGMRGEDIVCRYGGEEFVVILVETPLEAAQTRADRLLQETRHMNVLQRGESIGGITLSIGIATFPEHGSSVDGLLRAADQALYRAKQEGRDRFVVADSTAQRTNAAAAAAKKA